MFPSNWMLHVNPEAKDKVTEWLADEEVQGYSMVPTTDAVHVGFNNIDDAFRFRLQFDEELLS